jgi:four helix bundle protein
VGQSFRDLEVWQLAIDMTAAIYRLAAKFPKEEIFALSHQLKRASVSVASNIAEGYGRGTTRDYLQFLAIARGSNSEVETQLVIARRLNFGQDADLQTAEKLNTRVGKMLNALMKSLRN